MIRKIESKDKNEYIAMSKMFYQSKAVIKPKKPKYLTKTFKDMISNNPYIDGCVYEVDGKIAGYMLLTFSYSNELGGEIVHIDELYIKDEYQGLGFGSQMLKYIETTYPEQNAITLLINDSNRSARKLYNKKGFKPVEYSQMIKDNQRDIQDRIE